MTTSHCRGFHSIKHLSRLAGSCPKHRCESFSRRSSQRGQVLRDNRPRLVSRASTPSCEYLLLKCCCRLPCQHVWEAESSGQVHCWCVVESTFCRAPKQDLWVSPPILGHKWTHWSATYQQAAEHEHSVWGCPTQNTRPCIAVHCAYLKNVPIWMVHFLDSKHDSQKHRLLGCRMLAWVLTCAL